MYQIIQQGIPMTILGRLGADLVTTTTDSGKRYCKLNIAVSAGRKKDANEEYQNVTHWVSATVWDDEDGAAKAFLDVVEKPPSEGLAFKKGNLVLLSIDAITEAREYDNKLYIDYKILCFKHCAKLLVGGGSGNTEGEATTQTSSTKTREPKSFMISKEADNFDADAPF